MRQHILFDLDGTLTDPAEGITRSILYACQQLGLSSPSQETLLSYIGPPIQRTFAALLQTDNAEAIGVAVRLYRKRYSAQGMLIENMVYPGVESMLQHLRQAGKQLYVATSKPTVYAIPILQHFGLDTHFTGIYGSELDGTRADKADLIAYILQTERLPASTVAMVGDRSHDIIGAKKNGILAIGVTYGYGTVEELIAATADVLCHSPSDVSQLLCDLL